MALRVPKLQPLLPCVWVISVPMASSVAQVLAPDKPEVELFVSLFRPGSVSFQHTCWLRSSLCGARFQDARRVVWAMFVIYPTNDSILFVLNSDSASKLSLTYKITSNKPTWDNINFKWR